MAGYLMTMWSKEEEAFVEDADTWPPRSYTCSFCRKIFRSAQALGGHMNVHRRDRARLRQGIPVDINGSTLPCEMNFPSDHQALHEILNPELCFVYSNDYCSSRPSFVNILSPSDPQLSYIASIPSGSLTCNPSSSTYINSFSEVSEHTSKSISMFPSDISEPSTVLSISTYSTGAPPFYSNNSVTSTSTLEDPLSMESGSTALSGSTCTEFLLLNEKMTDGAAQSCYSQNRESIDMEDLDLELRLG